MKRILILLIFLLSVSLFAEEVDLAYKFTDGEVKKSNVIITVDGMIASQSNGMSQPFKSQYKGVLTQKTTLTKDKTAKNIVSYSMNEIQSNNNEIAAMVTPKTIGFETNEKGKLFNILDEKGNVIQKVTDSSEEFPIKAIPIDTTWTSLTSAAGVNLVAKSTLKNIKTVNDEKYAFITKAIESPIDIATLMKMMNLSTDILGTFDQLEFAAYVKGDIETLFNVTKGETTQANDKLFFYLQGSLYGNVILEGQFNITYEQKAFTPEEYKKAETK